MDTDPCRRIRVAGTVSIALPPREAFNLFTASGERAWAHGWHPVFPSPALDETEPGIVFQTHHEGHESTWVVVECDSGNSIGYAVTTSGERSGLVTIACRPSPGGTVATVSYDLTALSPVMNVELDQFAMDYALFLREWERSIAAFVAREAR